MISTCALSQYESINVRDYDRKKEKQEVRHFDVEFVLAINNPKYPVSM